MNKTLWEIMHSFIHIYKICAYKRLSLIKPQTLKILSFSHIWKPCMTIIPKYLWTSKTLKKCCFPAGDWSMLWQTKIKEQPFPKCIQFVWSSSLKLFLTQPAMSTPRKGRWKLLVYPNYMLSLLVSSN